MHRLRETRLADGTDDERELQSRLDKLSTSLGDRGKPNPTKPETGSSKPGAPGNAGLGSAMGAGFRVVSEIVAGVLVGGGIGWLIDRAVGTKPLFMILIGSLGLAAGFWNVIREAMRPPQR